MALGKEVKFEEGGDEPGGDRESQLGRGQKKVLGWERETVRGANLKSDWGRGEAGTWLAGLGFG